MKRRSLLGYGVLTAASQERIPGANGRVRIALVGCGGRGRYVSGFMREVNGVELACCADVDLRKARREAEAAGGAADVVQDFRKALERKDIDAVVVATPDHWHAGVTVMACRAGKHVYIEKPLTHNIREGRALVNAAEAGGTIVQAGLQHRSAPHFEECAGLVRSGALGKVHFVKIWNANNMGPAGIGTQPDGEAPAELDWDFYCGPAPLRRYNPLRAGPTFRWFRDYATGFITDFGAHRFGTVHHVMGVDAPRTVSASGGRFAVGGMGEMPDLMVATYEYEGFVLSYEGSNLNAFGMPRGGSGLKYYNQRGLWDRPNGMAFHGTKGTLFADRIGYEYYPEPVRPGAGPAGEAMWKQGADATRLHAQSFIRNIRENRKPEASAEFGHRVTSAALLGNIALATGAKLKWDAGREEFEGGPAAAGELLGRDARGKWDFAGVQTSGKPGGAV
jgi:predicted dehydrogenase